MPVLLVIVESGAIYSATLTTLLVTYLTNSWAQYLLLDSVRPFCYRFDQIADEHAIDIPDRGMFQFYYRIRSS